MVTSRDTFLPREAMLLTSASRGPSAIAELLVYRATLCWSVIYYRRVSVCLSHSDIVSKRLNVGSRKSCSTIAPGKFCDAKNHGEIRTG